MIKRSDDACSFAKNLRKSERTLAVDKQKARQTRGKRVNEA